MRVGDQRGSWKLTDITMPSLLKAGYELRSVETLAATPKGNDKPAATSSGKTAEDEARTAYHAFYLEKPGSPNLYRCTEEEIAAKTVYCWEFDPIPALTGSIRQRDAPTNVLLGIWTGSVIENERSVPIRLTFTDTTMEEDIPHEAYSGLVVYDVAAGHIGVIPLSGKVQVRQTADFDVISVDRVIYRSPSYGPVSLDRYASAP